MLRQALMEQREEELWRQSADSASDLPVFEDFDQHFDNLRNGLMQKRNLHDSFTHFGLLQESKLFWCEL